VQRQALAGMLWTKQIYLFDVTQWLNGDNPNMPPPASRHDIRNPLEAPELDAHPVDAGQVGVPVVRGVGPGVPLRRDRAGRPAFAKENLWVLLFEQFQHPNGQIPAYEWEFSDLNPPVHAWACWRVYNDREGAQRHGRHASSWRSASRSC
jgi:hypothetical protein